MAKYAGAATLLFATTTATCGLFALREFGATASINTMIPAVAPDSTTSSTEPDAITTTTSTADPTTSTSSTPTSSTPTTTTTTTTTPTTSTTSTPTTTTTTTTTPTTSTTSTPTTRTVGTPTSVAASSAFAGAGSVVTFDGRCDTAGRVFVQIIGPTTATINLGQVGPLWSYDWTAPADEAEFDTFAFRFFCGDPADFVDVYPPALEQLVDMVAIAAPPAPVLVGSGGPEVGSVLPETG